MSFTMVHINVFFISFLDGFVFEGRSRKFLLQLSSSSNIFLQFPQEAAAGFHTVQSWLPRLTLSVGHNASDHNVSAASPLLHTPPPLLFNVLLSDCKGFILGFMGKSPGSGSVERQVGIQSTISPLCYMSLVIAKLEIPSRIKSF